MSDNKARIKLLAIVIIVIVVLVAITPLIYNWAQKEIKAGHWDTIKEREWGTNTTTETPGSLNLTGIPNTSVNLTSDQMFSLSEFSTVETEFNPDYFRSTDALINVVDSNNTPVPSITFIISLKLISNAPWLIDYFVKDTYSDNLNTITVNQGEDGNQYDFGQIGGWPEDIGLYIKKDLTISLSDDAMAQGWAPFPTPDYTITGRGHPVFTVILQRQDQKLGQILDDISYSSINNDLMKTNRTYAGGMDGNLPGFGLNDAFSGFGAPSTNESFKPQISAYTDDCYKVVLAQPFRTKAISNVTLFTVSAYYEAYSMPTISSPAFSIFSENYHIFSGGIYDYVTGEMVYGADLAPLHSYYIVIIGYFNSKYTNLGLQIYISYTSTGSLATYEKIGYSIISYDRTDYRYGFQYVYSDYFTPNQTVHRTLTDDNFRLQIGVDVQTPYFLDGQTATFILRFGSATNYAGNDIIPHPFYIWVEIWNNSESLAASPGKIISVIQGSITSGRFTVDLTASGINPLQSYECRIMAESKPLDPSGGSHYAGFWANYTRCLYFTLKDYNDMRDDIINLNSIYNDLLTETDLTQGVYDDVADILGIMKPKVSDIKDSTDLLSDDYYNTAPDQFDRVYTSIEATQDYILWTSKFMDEHTAQDASGDDSLFTQYRNDIYRLGYWYADLQVQYNCMIAYLNGESQIGDEIGNNTRGYRDYFTYRWHQDGIQDSEKYLPPFVLIFALLISLFVAAIIYYTLRKRIKNKWISLIIVILAFVVTFIAIYMIIWEYNDMILRWYYGI